MFSRLCLSETDEETCDLLPKMEDNSECGKTDPVIKAEKTLDVEGQPSLNCSDELQEQSESVNVIGNPDSTSVPIDGGFVEQVIEPKPGSFGEPNPRSFREPTSRSYRCDECNVSFSRYTLLVAHNRKHKEGPPYFCDDCSQSFDIEDDWLDHREVGCAVKNTTRIHTNKRHRCTYYGTRQNKTYDGKSEGKRYCCHHCRKLFKTIGARNDHVRNLHKGLRPHRCDQCDKQFYRKFNLAVHKRKHSSDRPHECKICHKRFKSSVSVKIHMEIHSDKRPFMCENCGKVFKTLSVLESHRTIHTGETKFKCNMCGKSYRYRASLFVHMRTHTGQRPYSCNHCTASFMVKSHLTEHLRIHTGERPFECEFCEACFSRSISLKKHLKSHIRAGFDLNLDSAMYHAKLQARITPKDPHISPDHQHQFIPKVCHYIKDEIFASEEGSSTIHETRKESLTLYTKPPIDGEPLVVVTITGVGDGTNCVHQINKVRRENRASAKTSTVKIEAVEEASGILQGQEFVFVDNLKGNGTFQFTDLTPVSNNRENDDNLPVIYITDYDTSNENDAPQPIVLGQMSIDSGLCREWTIPQSVITDTELKVGRTSGIKASNTQVNDPQSCWLKSERRESVAISSDVKGECVDTDYRDKIDGTSFNQTSVKNEEDVLTDNKIKSLLLNRDISAGCDLNPGEVDKQSDTSLILAQLEESETVPSTKTKIKYSKRRRLPLRKCRYCDLSYRYVALLEAHEARHEVREEKPMMETNEDESELINKYIPITPTTGEDLPYKCDQCSCSFSFRSELRNHVKLHSNKYHYTCKNCHQAFQQEIFLAKHQCGRAHGSGGSVPVVAQNSHMTPAVPGRTKNKPDSGLNHKCDKCGEIFHKEFILKVHYRKHTGKRPYKCTDCNKIFISATHHKVHRRIHTGERPYVCAKCQRTFRRRTVHDHHVEACEAAVRSGRDDTQTDEANSATVCENIPDLRTGETVNLENMNSFLEITKEESKEELIDPEPQETEQKSHIETEDRTNTAEVKEDRDETHLSEVIGDDGVKDMSDKLQTEKVISGEFQMFESLEAATGGHVKTPPRDFQKRRRKLQGPHGCTHCPKSFKYLSTLHAHERSHTGEKPFSCTECGKTFSKKSNMVIHMRIHTGERPFLCDYCGKYFTNKYTLIAHKRLHTQERPFPCSICGKTFRYEASRHVHLKRHAGNRAHKCDLCPKAFVAKGDLDDHRRTHTGERPYKCDHCDRRFTARHHLTEHRRLHTGEKPFKCRFCPMTFARSGTCKMHVQRHLKTPRQQIL
ncbi:zinc finger protein 721-like [Homarus americanus]|uniref:Zinc finger protein 836-like n=1 Tax=Homarus americanus TaxID=6706 RepID=A0A8J5K286_HOMAM|nr:zinc finger protein 721-like [Homarus americanus]KAG7166158.1 Zinc finger protein 836-like [Homarus americanus]